MQVPPYLVNEAYDDRYFDVVDAIEEARHIFFHGCGLPAAIADAARGSRACSIGETGFGAGRLLLALIDFLEEEGVRGLAIAYHSVELHPVNAERMAAILAGFRPRLSRLIDLLVDAYGRLDITRPGWHELVVERPFGVLTLKLFIGEALDMVKALPAPCDAWFLDGHGPKKNPSIWRPELLMAVGHKTRPGGACATFTVAGSVRRGLEAAGFDVEQRPGLGGKKAVLRGVKRQ